MQLSYSRLNSFFRKKSVEYNSTIYLFAKIKGLLHKRVNKDKMNELGRPYIQLRYPWLNSFVSTISREQSMNLPN